MSSYDRAYALSSALASARADAMRTELRLSTEADRWATETERHQNPSRPGSPPGREDHWLLFDRARRVVGCRCGFKADVEADCGWGDSVVKHLLEVSVTWRAKCSCGWKCWGRPSEVERLTRQHDDSPLGNHIVSWDVPGVRPWSRTMEPA